MNYTGCCRNLTIKEQLMTKQRQRDEGGLAGDDILDFHSSWLDHGWTSLTWGHDGFSKCYTPCIPLSVDGLVIMSDSYT